MDNPLKCFSDLCDPRVERLREHLLEEIEDSFQTLAAAARDEQIDCAEDPQCGPGRVEQRNCPVIADLPFVEKAAEWASLQGLARIKSERFHKATGKTEGEIRSYITSPRPDAARLTTCYIYSEIKMRLPGYRSPSAIHRSDPDCHRPSKMNHM